MTETNSNDTTSIAINNPSKPNVVTLKEGFDALLERANAVGPLLEAAVPLTGRPAEVQEAFLLAFSDIKSLQVLARETQKTFNAINLTSLTSEQLEKADELDSTLAEMLSEMVADAVQAYGIDKAVIVSTIVKDLTRDVERIESIVTRLEAEAALLAN